MTRTLIEAIADTKGMPNSRAAQVQNLFQVYSIPFSRQMAVQIFGDVPATFKFMGHNKFQCEKCVFQPNTMADYISIVRSMGLSISPDFDGVYGNHTTQTKADEKFKQTLEMAVILFRRKPNR